MTTRSESCRHLVDGPLGPSRRRILDVTVIEPKNSHTNHSDDQDERVLHVANTQDPRYDVGNALFGIGSPWNQPSRLFEIHVDLAAKYHDSEENTNRFRVFDLDPK